MTKVIYGILYITLLAACSTTTKPKDSELKCIQVYKDGDVYKYREINCDELLVYQ